MYLQVKASSLDLQMPTRGRVAPRLGRAPQLGRQNAGYIFHKNDFMFYLSCFSFMFQPSDYQSVRKMKHNTSMFHF